MKDIIINILWCVGGVSLVSYLATLLYLNARESRAAEQERLAIREAARLARRAQDNEDLPAYATSPNAQLMEASLQTIVNGMYARRGGTESVLLGAGGMWLALWTAQKLGQSAARQHTTNSK